MINHPAIGCYWGNYPHLWKPPFIWANYNNSLTWIKAIWGWFLLLTMIIVRSQWGRYNLPRFMLNPHIWSRSADACDLGTGLRSQARQHPSQQRHSTWSPWEYPEPSGSTSLKSEYSPEKKNAHKYIYICVCVCILSPYMYSAYIYICIYTYICICILYASQYVFIFISLHTLNVGIKISHIHLLRLRVLRVACPGQSTKDTWRTKLRPDMWRIQWPDMWDIVNTSNQ